MFTVDVKQQNNNNNKKKQELFGEDVVVEEAYVCVAWWKGAAVTFGNSALFKDRYCAAYQRSAICDEFGESDGCSCLIG